MNSDLYRIISNNELEYLFDSLDTVNAAVSHYMRIKVAGNFYPGDAPIAFKFLCARFGDEACNDAASRMQTRIDELLVKIGWEA